MSLFARLAVVGVALALVPALLAQPTPAERPPAAEVKTAAETLRDVYDKEYAAADQSEADTKALAKKLLKIAPERKTPAMIFACYDEARRLAAQAGDVRTAFAAVEELKKRFADTGELSRDTLRTLAGADVPATEAHALVEQAREESAAALREGNFTRAALFTGYAAGFAKKLQDPDLALELREQRTKLESLAKAKAKVGENPKDPAANTVLGTYWAFDRGDWAAGLKYLANGSDDPLAEVAKLDVANPATATGRTTLGEKWHALATKATDAKRKRAFAERAWTWYTAAVAVATGDEDLKPAERAKRIESEFPDLFNAVFEGHASAVAALAVTPDGKTLVSVGNDNLVRVWDTASGKLVRSLDGHGGWVGSVVVTPDSAKAITAGGDNVIRIWDLKAGRPVATLEGHTVAVRGLALTADGKFLVSGGSDKTCRLWDLTTNKQVRKYGAETESVESVAVTADGSRVLAGSDNGIVTVYDAKTGSVVSRFDKHAGSMVYTVAVTRDGKTALSGARDKTIRVWDVATGKELRTLTGHTEQVYQVALSPDEKHVLSASFDKTIRIWDFATGKELKRFEGHADGVQGAVYSPDGRTVYSASWDKTVRRWRVPPGLTKAD